MCRPGFEAGQSRIWKIKVSDQQSAISKNKDDRAGAFALAEPDAQLLKEQRGT